MSNKVTHGECPECGSMSVLEHIPFPITGGEVINAVCSECGAAIIIEVEVIFNVR